jgi:hypothetical protein
MRKLVTLALMAVVVVAADVLARGWAESELAAQEAAYYPPSSVSSAEIHSFPFLGRLLVGGDDVKVDRSELFSGRVRVLDVGSGRVEALVDSPLARAAAAALRRGPS